MTTEVAPAEITLTGYEDVRAALGNADLVRSVDVERFERGNIMERVLLMLGGSEHRDRRRAENLLFRRETIERFEREVLPPVVEATIGRAAALGRGDLLDLGGQIAVVMAATIAGVDADLDSDAERERLSAYLHSFARGEAIDAATGDVETIKRSVMEDLAEFDERYLRPARVRREALLAELDAAAGNSAFDSPFDPAVVTGGDRTGPADVLGTLLRSRVELGIDDQLLVREAAFFFEAGAHTSTQTFTNALHQIMAWLAEPGRGEPRWHEDLAWVQRAVHEALRLRPTNPLMRRRAERDTEIR
jgi:cytochrome P450